MSEITDKPEDVLEGDIQTPNVRTKNFHTPKQVAEFLYWSSPKEFSVQTGRGGGVYQVQWRESLMTTIVYNHKDREIATDSQATAGYTIVDTSVTKLYRVSDGWLAFCGNWADAQCLMDYLMGEEEVELKALEVGAFVMPDTGNPYQIILSSAGRVQRMPIRTHFALGSGSSFALGALEAGASAKDAVKAAIKYDVFSSGRVVVKNRGAKKLSLILTQFKE